MGVDGHLREVETIESVSSFLYRFWTSSMSIFLDHQARARVATSLLKIFLFGQFDGKFIFGCDV